MKNNSNSAPMTFLCFRDEAKLAISRINKQLAPDSNRCRRNANHVQQRCKKENESSVVHYERTFIRQRDRSLTRRSDAVENQRAEVDANVNRTSPIAYNERARTSANK